MMRKIIRGFVSAALLGGAVNAFAGPGLADGGAKFLGNITTRGQVRSDFGTYWNQITAENECKWGSIEGSRGRFNWSGCDACYNWAKKNGGKFKFHALVWGGQYPSWLNGLSADETRKAITTWFDAVAERYPDLEMIDVVNEAIRTGNNNYHSPYGKGNNIIPALGGDNGGNYAFVTTAFKMARERWPKAILIYNDYNTFRWQINEGIQLVNQIVKDGAPVDAYGQQAHDLTDMNANEFKSALNKIQTSVKNAKGEPMPLFITEYDIGTDNDNQQKQRYSEQISAFWESPQVAGITLWGYIYGATWTTNGNSGIIKNNQDRPAMTWLKDYFKQHLKDGKDNTGLFAPYVPPEPVPRKPFKGSALPIPGKIEVEDFDITGVGETDGVSNVSYNDGDSENHGDSDYRKADAPDADLYKKATGVIMGYNNTGDWFEYSVDVKEAGDYTVYASVAADGSGAFTLSVDGKSVGEVAVTGSSWDTFQDVKANVTLPAGKHILRMTVTTQFFDIDYLNFVAGKDAPNPGGSGNENGNENPLGPGSDAIQTSIHMETPVLGDYYVFDVNGVRIGRLSAYTMDEAVTTLKNSSAIKVQGVYLLRSVKNGAVKPVRVAR
jgi:GH35 family endo-1,4-beta-xylanase